MTPAEKWLKKTEKDPSRCGPAQNMLLRLANAGDLEHYYSRIPYTGYFLNGLIFRQPDLAVSTICKLIIRFAGEVKEEYISVFNKITNTEEELINSDHRQINITLRNVPKGSEDYYFVRSLFLLAELRMGKAKVPAKTATTLGMSVASYLRKQGGDPEAEGIILAWLRKEVPFSLWKQGFPED
jgi:hypothetical protein